MRPLALGASALVHVAAILALVLMVDGRSGARFPAPPTIELMLPPMASAPASAVAPTESAAIEPVEAAEPEVPEVVEAIEPEPVAVPVMAEAVEAPDAEVVVAKAEEPEKPKPKPPAQKPKPRSEKPPKPKPVKPAAAPPALPAPADAPLRAVAAPRSAGPAAVPGGGSPGARADYTAKVLAWVQRHKRYPDRLRRRQITGKPVVHFTLDGSGHVTSCRIVTSSGRPDLDEAALATIRRADPFPAPPADLARPSYDVPIEFTLNR